MPTIEYKCTACTHDFTIQQKMSEERLRHCPACQQETLRVVIQKTGFRLNGNDYESTG